MMDEIAVAWRMARGYRLFPWRSPYLRWRMETWSGLHAEAITPGIFLGFVWQHRADLWRYLRWAAKESGDSGPKRWGTERKENEQR